MRERGKTYILLLMVCFPSSLRECTSCKYFPFERLFGLLSNGLQSRDGTQLLRIARFCSLIPLFIPDKLFQQMYFTFPQKLFFPKNTHYILICIEYIKGDFFTAIILGRLLKTWWHDDLWWCWVREGVKKQPFFWGDLSQIWVGGGVDSQTFGDIYQPLFLSTKVPKCGAGAVKTQNQIQIVGEIYYMHLIIPK